MALEHLSASLHCWMTVIVYSNLCFAKTYIEPGALTAKNLKRIVIDASHIDQKKRGILGMKETHEPLAKLLNREEIHRRYNSATDNIDIIFY